MLSGIISIRVDRWQKSGKPIEREGQYKRGKIEFQPDSTDTEKDFHPVEFSTLTFAGLLDQFGSHWYESPIAQVEAC